VRQFAHLLVLVYDPTCEMLVAVMKRLVIDPADDGYVCVLDRDVFDRANGLSVI
jgi:hypothetical protein